MRRRQLYPPAILLATICLALLLLAGLSAPEPVSGEEEPARPHIIFVVVDALRADHVSGYGYERQTTPNLDALFLDGVRFADATVSAPWTYPSVAALLTGRRPSQIGEDWADPESRLAESEVLLAERLDDAGYYTAGFYTAHYVGERFGFGQGFDHYARVSSDEPGAGPNADEVNRQAFAWLDDVWMPTIRGKQPLFLLLYYYDPHSWYDPPAPFDVRYDSDYTGTVTPELFGHAEKVIAGELELTERDLEHVISLYDGEIAYWDFHFGEMIDHLDSLGLVEDSIIVFTSDHGQMFGEHGHWIHRNALYEEVLRVPLYLDIPGLDATGLTITTPVQTVDVLPTLLSGLDLPLPPAVDGLDLTPLITGKTAMSRTVYAELDAMTDANDPLYPLTAHQPWYTLRRDGWKYFHHPPVTWPDELYHLAEGAPYERENVLEDESERAASMRADLLDTFDLPSEYLFLPVLGRP